MLMFMDPQQQNGQFNPQQYDFITNPQKPKKSLFGGGGQNKLFMIAVGLGVFTFIILLLALVFGGGAGSDVDQLKRIGRQQTEVIQVAAMGDEFAGRSETRAHAKSAELTLISQQQQLIQFLETNENESVSASDLEAIIDPETEQQLTNAAADGRFDDIFTRTMNESISSYQSVLETTFDSVEKESSRDLLAQFFEQTELLIQ